MDPRIKYKTSQTLAWTRIDMLLIYDQAVATLSEGVRLLENNRLAELHPVSLKAMRTLLMIADGLNLDQGELPAQVMRLVVFSLDQIKTQSPQAWRDAARVMSTLREGFQEIQEQARQDEYAGRIPALDAVHNQIRVELNEGTLASMPSHLKTILSAVSVGRKPMCW